MAAIRQVIHSVLKAEHPLTIRGLFYRLVGRGVIPKSERSYKGVVVRLATLMRLEGQVPFAWVADHTRWRQGSRVFASGQDWLEASRQAYRLDLWRDHDCYCEVWIEKDAIAGILFHETDPLCVPLMPCRGYPSITYLADAAAHIRRVGRPTFIYYLGDFDPSGLDIPRTVERRLREFAPSVSITFERVAVTAEQIEELRLPTRPTKTTDSRAGRFKGASVEVDAVPTALLRRWVRERIEKHLDPVKLAAIQREEALGREALAGLRLPGWSDDDWECPV